MPTDPFAPVSQVLGLQACTMSDMDPLSFRWWVSDQCYAAIMGTYSTVFLVTGQSGEVMSGPGTAALRLLPGDGLL